MTQPKPTPALEVLDNPGFLPFLPMLYLAWADGTLSASEIQAFHEIALEGDLLKPESKKQIQTWLDPENPPSSADLFNILRRVRKVAGSLKETENQSLVELGLSLCRQEAPDLVDYWHNSANLQALTELETSLGMTSHEALFEILGKRPPAQHPYKDLTGEKPPRFAIDAMREVLDGRYQTTIAYVRRLLSAPIFDFQPEASKEVQRDRVMRWLGLFSEQGLGGKAYPDVTGAAPDLGEFMAVFETMAYFDLSLTVKMGVQFGLFGGSIYFLGTQTQRDELLPDIASGKTLGCFAMSELGHGSNVRDLLTTATFDPATDEWVIHTPEEAARKEWIGGVANDARLATVFAQLITEGACHGVHAFVVPLRGEDGNPLPGIRIADCGHKMGLNGVDNGIIWFKQVRIPRHHLLARFAEVGRDGRYTSPIVSSGKRFFTMLGTLVGGRVSVAAAGVSVSKTALTIAIRYAAMRRQFGPEDAPETPILDYPIHQRRLLPRLATTYALNFAVRHLVDCYTGRIETDPQKVEAMAAAIKAMATWHNNETVQECRERCGGQGFLTVNRLPGLKADSDVFATFEGDNVVLMQLVAKAVLTDFRRQFEDSKFLGTWQIITQKIGKVFGPTSFLKGVVEEPVLRSPQTHADLFYHRQADLTLSLARRISKRVKAGLPLFEAFKQCQNHALSLGKAYADRLVHQAFRSAIHAETRPEIRRRLMQLCQLYGLSRWEADLAWFTANNLTSTHLAKMVPKMVTKVCSEIRPQAVHLVNAFAIPDNCLAAPIAFEKPLAE